MNIQRYKVNNQWIQCIIKNYFSALNHIGKLFICPVVCLYFYFSSN